jgi:hypothetical protein
VIATQVPDMQQDVPPDRDAAWRAGTTSLPMTASQSEADWADAMLALIFRRGPWRNGQCDRKPFAAAAPEFCRRHLIDATLLSALPDSGLPDDVIANLTGSMQIRSLYRDGLHQRLAAAVAEIGPAFEEKGISWRLMKGPCLQQAYYGALKREYFDLDILVPERQFARAKGVLTRLHWRTRKRGFVPMTLVRRFEHGLGLQRGDAIVDLHWSLRVHPAYRIDRSRVFAGERKLPYAGIEVPVLEPEYDLTLCLLSIARGIERDRATLRDAIDLYLMLRALDSSLCWRSFFDARKRERTDRVCGGLLAAAVAWLDQDKSLTSLRDVLNQSGYVQVPSERNPLKSCICLENARGDGRRWYLSAYAGSLPSYWLHTVLSIVVNQEFPYNLPRTYLFRRFVRR